MGLKHHVNEKEEEPLLLEDERWPFTQIEMLIQELWGSLSLSSSLAYFEELDIKI